MGRKDESNKVLGGKRHQKFTRNDKRRETIKSSKLFYDGIRFVDYNSDDFEQYDTPDYMESFEIEDLGRKFDIDLSDDTEIFE